MPKLGESIMEATILKWLKQPGDAVQQDETVLEIATDKVDSEVPSTTEGVIEEILFQVNDVVPIGSVIARIRSNTTAAQPQPSAHPQPPVQESRPAVQSQPVAGSNGQHTAQKVQNDWSGGSDSGYRTQSAVNRFYSPLVLNIAASEGVHLAELENIPGTGNEGRVTKKDILQYVSERRSEAHQYSPPQQDTTHQREPAAASFRQPVQESQPYARQSNAHPQPAVQTSPATAPTQAGATSQPTVYSGNVEIIEMDRMRRLIADHMVRSKHTSPHVTSFAEADVTNLVQWRDRVKQEFEKREGTKITFTPLFIEAIVRCIKKYPLINCSLDGDKIIIKKDINFGMATALPTGNLIVPVIRNADQLSLVGLTRQVNALADNARNSRLRPEDTQGGTFTMTNVGTFGSLMGTPIINQPQVAILAVGAIKKRPVVLETKEGDSIAIRHMMYLSLSYDHRIVDGSIGASFLTAVARELENFPPDREY
ncbi:MAG TPA: dihydrolipoamide acetyltransferase family protein [Puia sp.]|nr:dihydrolipoamide acetyltransferase family protein [Puia sp.]